VKSGSVGIFHPVSILDLLREQRQVHSLINKRNLEMDGMFSFFVLTEIKVIQGLMNQELFLEGWLSENLGT
jgi:hypothetical protein